MGVITVVVKLLKVLQETPLSFVVGCDGSDGSDIACGGSSGGVILFLFACKHTAIISKNISLPTKHSNSNFFIIDRFPKVHLICGSFSFFFYCT